MALRFLIVRSLCIELVKALLQRIGFRFGLEGFQVHGQLVEDGVAEAASLTPAAELEAFLQLGLTNNLNLKQQ